MHTQRNLTWELGRLLLAGCPGHQHGGDWTLRCPGGGTGTSRRANAANRNAERIFRSQKPVADLVIRHNPRHGETRPPDGIWDEGWEGRRDLQGRDAVGNATKIQSTVCGRLEPLFEVHFLKIGPRGSSASCSTDRMRSRRVWPGLGPMICGRCTTARLANARTGSRYSARTPPELVCCRRSSAQPRSGALEGERPHPVHVPVPTAFPLLESAPQVVVPPQVEARSVQPRQEQPIDAASHPQRYQASPADQMVPQALRTPLRPESHNAGRRTQPKHNQTANGQCYPCVH